MLGIVPTATVLDMLTVDDSALRRALDVAKGWES